MVVLVHTGSRLPHRAGIGAGVGSWTCRAMAAWPSCDPSGNETLQLRPGLFQVAADSIVPVLAAFGVAWEGGTLGGIVHRSAGSTSGQRGPPASCGPVGQPIAGRLACGRRVGRNVPLLS